MPGAPLPVLAALLALLISYLLGSLVFGVLYSRLRGRDIRDSDLPGGSGTYRQYGLVASVTVTALDILKGVAAVFIARALARGFGLEHIGPEHIGLEHTGLEGSTVLDWLACLGVVAGHCYPLYFRFDGGAGVATFAGAFIVAAPETAVILYAVSLALIPLYRRTLQTRLKINAVPAVSVAMIPLGAVLSLLLGGLPSFAAGGAVMVARGLQMLRRPERTPETASRDRAV